jgi:hypothetical protein
MGTAGISPVGKVEAGSFRSFNLVYTAGYFGIDDTGSIKIVHRFASDMGRPQWSDPKAANYTTIEASNGAVLDVLYDPKLNIRPWDKTLMIRVMRGFLRGGDTITVRFGDRRKGSPGMRVQTFVEPTFEFRVLVDAFATYNYVELPIQPTISVVAGPPAAWKAVLPTLRRCDENFRFGFKGEDRWGNPSDQVEGVFSLRASRPILGLPEIFSMRRGDHAKSIESLSVTEPGDLRIEVLDAGGRVLCISNPLRIAAEAPLRSYWCDLHGQSEETIGTNSARELIEFARDRAFLDGMSHQGNDFQITTAFWNELNELSRAYNEDGSFIIFPGYEWSGNTGLGGDRNVLFMREGRQIHRSSHALINDQGDLSSDANSAEQLVRCAEERGLRRLRPYRWPLRRHRDGARRTDRAIGRGTFRLGHLRMAGGGCVQTGIPRRHSRQFGRPQGSAWREPSGRLAVRGLWRTVLPARQRFDPDRAVRCPATTPSLRDHGLSHGARRSGSLPMPRPSSMPTTPTWAQQPAHRRARR